MARQVITKMIDDLDGSEADETVSFALDGNAYEIDLSGPNGMKLRELLGTYIEAGTRVGRVPQIVARGERRGGRTGPSFEMPSTGGARQRELNTEIRQWAIGKGMQISERGRIPQHVVDAYNRRNKKDDEQPELDLSGEEPQDLAVEEVEPEADETAIAKAAKAARKSAPPVPSVDFKTETPNAAAVAATKPAPRKRNSSKVA